MVVDDDGEVLDAFEDVLRDAGHDVVCFRNGKQALQYLSASRRPDVVLLDLSMPVMNGREFLAEFVRREELADVPVLMITGSDGSEDYPVPPERVMHKPIQISNLLDAIADLTRDRGH